MNIHLTQPEPSKARSRYLRATSVRADPFIWTVLGIRGAAGTPLALAGLASLAALLFLSACATRLDRAGPYHGDEILFRAHQSTTTGYELLRDFVRWEKSNREAFNTVPEVGRVANEIRLHGKDWVRSSIALADAYKANPNEQTKTALSASLDVIQTAISQVLLTWKTYATNSAAR